MLYIQYLESLLRELDFHASRKSQPLTGLEITWAEEQWKNLAILNSTERSLTPLPPPDQR